MKYDHLNLSRAQITPLYGELFDHYVPAMLSDAERKVALERLAERFDTSVATINRGYDATQDLTGNGITGTVLRTMCYLVEKMQTYNLEIIDERLWSHSATLQQEAEAGLRTEFDAEIESLTADFARREEELTRAAARREEELTQAAERAHADLEARRDEFDEQSRQLALDRDTIASERADLDAWREELAREADLLAERGHPRRVILAEMRDGGLLGASPRESVYSAQLRLMAMSGSGSYKKTRDRRVKEAAFHTITAPVRWVLDVLLP